MLIRLLSQIGKNAVHRPGLKQMTSAKKSCNDFMLVEKETSDEEKINALVDDFELVEFDENEGFFREIFSKLFYFLLKNFSEIKIISKTTDFMLLSKKICLK